MSCTSALLGYTVSILSFIGNSLVPKSEHLCFFIVVQEHFFEYVFLCLSKYGKKGLASLRKPQ